MANKNANSTYPAEKLQVDTPTILLSKSRIGASASLGQLFIDWFDVNIKFGFEILTYFKAVINKSINLNLKWIHHRLFILNAFSFKCMSSIGIWGAVSLKIRI